MKFRRISLLLLFILITDILCSVIFFNDVNNNFPSPKNNRFDAAVVFWGGDDGNANSETLRRIDYATRLFNNGLIGNIVCVGGARFKMNFYGAEVMRQHFLSNGIPKKNLWYEKKSYDSISNLSEANKIIQKEDFKKVILLSSSLHLFRLKYLVSNQLNVDTLSFSPYSYDSSKHQISLSSLWLNIHYEWLAFSMITLLPKSTYHRFISAFRNGSGLKDLIFSF